MISLLNNHFERHLYLQSLIYFQGEWREQAVADGTTLLYLECYAITARFQKRICTAGNCVFIDVNNDNSY